MENRFLRPGLRVPDIASEGVAGNSWPDQKRRVIALGQAYPALRRKVGQWEILRGGGYCGGGQGTFKNRNN